MAAVNKQPFLKGNQTNYLRPVAKHFTGWDILVILVVQQLFTCHWHVTVANTVKLRIRGGCDGQGKLHA
jgi:hypothetical protein